MRVGIPMMKCSLNPSQQVNKQTGKRSKTCGVKSAWEEMNDERLGRDPTIDKEMTHMNVWMEGSSDMDVEEIIKQEIERINLERKMHGKRALRSDTVSCIAIVEKPNMEYMQNLSYEERKKFLYTSHEEMKKLIHEWNPNWKILAACQHHDEFGGLSAHNHTLVMVSTIDKDGLPNMKAKSEFNLKFFTFINKNYSVRMQSRGYEVEHVRTFDQLSDEEKIERKLHPEDHGVDAYIYKQKKQKELEQSIKDLEIKQTSLSDELEKTVIEITQAPDLKSYTTILNENESLKSELALKDRIIEKLKTEIESLKLKMESWKNTFTEISHKAGVKLMSLFGYDVHESVRNDYPQIDILEKFNSMQKGMREYDPACFRVIPDKQNEGRFCIVYKNKSHQYETFENNILNRRIAENKIKEMKHHSKLHAQTIEHKIK